MNLSENTDYKIKYSVYGFAIGVALRVIFIINGLLNNASNFSLYDIYELYNNYPVNLLFDFFVIVSLTLMGYALGKFFSQSKNEILGELIEEKEKTKGVFKYTEALRKGAFADDDTLGMKNELSKSLVNLRDELKQKEDEVESRKKGDDQRHWITEGIAKFGGILRETSNNLEVLSYSVVSNLSTYVNAQVVGIYVINDSDSDNLFIEETGAFAYGREKFTNKAIEWGEGLIGACAQEMATIYLTDVPDEYNGHSVDYSL